MNHCARPPLESPNISEIPPTSCALASDLSGGILAEPVTPIEAVIMQVENIGLGSTIDHVQPLLAGIDKDAFNVLGHLRQLDAGLHCIRFCVQQATWASERDNMQLRTRGSRDQQSVFVSTHRHMFQRPLLLIQHDRRAAIRVFQRPG